MHAQVMQCPTCDGQGEESHALQYLRRRWARPEQQKDLPPCPSRCCTASLVAMYLASPLLCKELQRYYAGQTSITQQVACPVCPLRMGCDVPGRCEEGF